MNDYGDNNNGSRLPLWGRIVALVVGAVVVVGGFYYKAHPQLLQRQLGSFGAELLGIGAGVYLAFEAITGIRYGTISGTYTTEQFKRSENPQMFWFIVSFNLVLGALALLVGIGLIFGVVSA